MTYIYIKLTIMKKQHLMPALFIAVILGGILSLQSCGKLANLLNFKLNMQTDSVNVTIPVTTGVNGEITVGPAVTIYNVDSFIHAQTGNQLGISNITSVKIQAVTFTLSNPDSLNNFQDFSSVSANFSSNTNPNPYTVSIPNNPDVYAATLSVPVDTSVELKTYLGTQFSYTLIGKLRRSTTKPLNCTITFKFNVAVQG